VTGSSPRAPTVSESLARWVAELSFDRLPADVVRMARRCLLDTVGCALQGSTTPEAGLLRQVRGDLGGLGPCTVWGLPGGAAPQAAALLNGTHAHLRELDDIGGGGHAGACQVPAALAAAELSGGDGKAVLLGLVAGHEIASRLTDGASYDTMTLHGWHTTGVYGALGAAAAAARVMGLDASGTAHALGLAGSYVGGTWAFMADGAMSKRVHPGRSAETGLTAALLARRGVTGPREVLDAEIDRIVDMGVELRLETKVEDLLDAMRGYDAAFVAVGAHIGKRAYIPAGEAAHILEVAVFGFLRRKKADDEPVDMENPLLHMDNVIVTPHIASATARMMPETRRRLGREMATVLSGRWPRSAVNAEVLSHTKLLRWQPISQERGPGG